jgi:hypothetical protein
VFESAEDLAAGLDAVLADRDVAVERVRDRLGEAYDAAATCGYRSRPPPQPS